MKYIAIVEIIPGCDSPLDSSADVAAWLQCHFTSCEHAVIEVHGVEARDIETEVPTVQQAIERMVAQLMTEDIIEREGESVH